MGTGTSKSRQISPPPRPFHKGPWVNEGRKLSWVERHPVQSLKLDA